MTVSVTYTGEWACSTREPSLDWKPGETKDLDQADAEALMSNVLFQYAKKGPAALPSLIQESANA